MARILSAPWCNSPAGTSRTSTVAADRPSAVRQRVSTTAACPATVLPTATLPPMAPTPEPAPETPPPDIEDLYDPDEVFRFDGTPEDLADAILKPQH